MLTIMHFLALCMRKESPFEKRIFGFLSWLFRKVIVLWFLVFGCYYGYLFGIGLGFLGNSIANFFNLESSLFVYIPLALSTVCGILVACIPAYFVHFAMAKLEHWAGW